MSCVAGIAAHMVAETGRCHRGGCGASFVGFVRFVLIHVPPRGAAKPSNSSPALIGLEREFVLMCWAWIEFMVDVAWLLLPHIHHTVLICRPSRSVAETQAEAVGHLIYPNWMLQLSKLFTCLT